MMVSSVYAILQVEVGGIRNERQHSILSEWRSNGSVLLSGKGNSQRGWVSTSLGYQVRPHLSFNAILQLG